MRILYNNKAILLLAGSAMTIHSSSAFVVRGVGSHLISRGSTNTNGVASYVNGQQNRLFMGGFLKDLFAAPQVASQDEILKAFQDPKATVIDVRSPAEITTKVDAQNWINAPGTPFNCPLLAEGEASKVLPDKAAPVILYLSLIHI